ncbi:MAG: siphovirus ReqiPepy6 Gp37-like family protein [Lachnospiraceae bacterium]|nr:siphovirus ReqiPepy6 Gp37-like family protein [Lachnospiraceae bacterium]
MELYVCRYVQPSIRYYEDAPYYVPDRVIVTYTSLIWCERFQEPGEFELCMRATQELLRYFSENELLILRKDTDRGMIPEYVELMTDTENGSVLKISGRSAECLLHRRVITGTETWTENYASGTAAGAVLMLAERNIGSFWYYHTSTAGEYQDKYRYLPFLDIHNLALDELTADFPAKINAQPFGRNLGEFTTEMCRAGGFGYRITVDKDTVRMLLEVYNGTDRTIEQEENAPVVFSPAFGNLGSTIYRDDRRTYCNAGYAAGEGEGRDREIGYALDSVKAMGATRREVFADAKSTSSKSDGINGDMSKYRRLLLDVAMCAIEQRPEQIDFSGTALPRGQFRYRQGYSLGDKVTVQNEYGINGSAIVTEVAEVFDESGVQIVPVLTAVGRPAQQEPGEPVSDTTY